MVSFPPKTYFTCGHHNYHTKKLLYQEKESLLLQLQAGLNIYRLKVFGIVDKAYWNWCENYHLNRLYFKTLTEMTHLIWFKTTPLYCSATIKWDLKMNVIYIDFITIPRWRQGMKEIRLKTQRADREREETIKSYFYRNQVFLESELTSLIYRTANSVLFLMCACGSHFH